MALESDTGARWDSTASLEKQLVAMLVQMGYAEGGSYVCAALRDALARSQQEEVSCNCAGNAPSTHTCSARCISSRLHDA